MFEPLSMLAALAPSGVQVVNSLVQRWIAPDAIKPTSVAEAVQLTAADTEKLRVITQADVGGETYKWVEAIRKLQRPVVVFATLAAFLYSPDVSVIADVFQVVMWYLFGERVRMLPRASK